MSTLFDDDVQTLRGEMAQLRKACAPLTETVATTARDGRREAGHLAQDTLRKVKTEAASAVHDVAAEVDARPLTSALAAFGIGFLAGLLVGPRRA